MIDVKPVEPRLVLAKTYTNPVYPEYFADPFVFQHDEIYYAFGTGPLSDDESWGEFRVLRSHDLASWEVAGVALKKPVGFEEGTYWAPEIAFSGSLFYMYYSVGSGDKGHQIRVAVSAYPEGPYQDIGRLTPEECPFAIDASPYRHEDGEWYLFYATDFLDGDRPGTGLVVDRLIDMVRLEGNPQVVARASADWQRFQSERPIYDGVHDWHTLEGPCAIWHEGKVYCLYSGGNWQNETYGVDYVEADHPLGPYVNDSPGVPRVLQTLKDTVLGPGHNSIAKGPNGRLYVVYHAWNVQRTARLMRIDPLVWTTSGPVCEGPSMSERPLV
jgi:GH43 family beta-xylosidase